MIVEIGEVPGASGYRVTNEGPSGREVIVFSDSTSTFYNILNLVPDTQYTVRVYTDTGTGYDLNGEKVVSTLADSRSNYSVLDFQDGDGFDLRGFDDTRRGYLSSVMTDLFSTGDVVTVRSTRNSDLKTSFVNLGDAFPIKDLIGDAVLLPFEETSGTGQNVSVTLSDDSTTVPISFDENSNTVTVDSVAYTPGSSFILDNKKVQVLDF